MHYTSRYGAAKDQSGFGVLYPDKDKITTLAPRMLNGAPGYAFKPPTPARNQSVARLDSGIVGKAIRGQPRMAFLGLCLPECMVRA